jgi:hypothetical protein
MKIMIEDMLNRIDVEYLKRINAVRKRMGLSLDADQVNRHSFLTALADNRKTSKK